MVEDGPGLDHGGAEQTDDAEAEGVSRYDEVSTVLRVEPPYRRVARVLLGAVAAAVTDGLVRSWSGLGLGLGLGLALALAWA